MKIGFFDSGIGGMTVLHRAMERMPDVDLLYYADSDHVPYGEKSNEAIMRYTQDALALLIREGCNAAVVACNTATSIAIATLRATYDLPILGMEPAVKPAVAQAEGKRVMVIATPVTLREEKLRTLLDRVDEDGCVDLLPMPGLVRFAEREEYGGEALEAYLTEQFAPYDPEEYEALVLGCTHFNYFADSLQRHFPHTALVDGIEGTVRHLMDTLAACGLTFDGQGTVTYYESGRLVTDPEKLARFARLHARLDALAQ